MRLKCSGLTNLSAVRPVRKREEAAAGQTGRPPKTPSGPAESCDLLLIGESRRAQQAACVPDRADGVLVWVRHPHGGDI